MGIDHVQLRLITDLSTRFSPKGRGVMLGRQNFRVNPKNRLRANRILRTAGYDLRWRDVVQEDGFSETLWDKLGYGAVETMDMSDYEGATIIHDLNQPVPPELEGQFDFIYDGGTLEHVFNVPTALASMFRMLKPGGRFVSCNGMNGWVGHGFYQFNPDLAWTFWRRACGCTVHRCMGVARDEAMPDLDFLDVGDYGTRLRLRGKLPATRVYLYYEVEKTPESKFDGTVLQSDYLVRWAGEDGDDAGEDAPERAEQ